MRRQLKNAVDAEMAMAIRLYQRGQQAAAFRHLEVAHVLGQRYVVPHILSHWWMLKIGLQRSSMPEVIGQAARIVLGAIGSAIGVIPTGNTGGTNISIFKRLPIDPALHDLLK